MERYLPRFISMRIFKLMFSIPVKQNVIWWNRNFSYSWCDIWIVWSEICQRLKSRKQWEISPMKLPETSVLFEVKLGHGHNGDLWKQLWRHLWRRSLQGRHWRWRRRKKKKPKAVVCGQLHKWQSNSFVSKKAACSLNEILIQKA